MKRKYALLLRIGVGYLVSLAAIFALVPLESTRYDLAAAMLMLVFGPYLLVVGCPTGFVLEPGTFLGLVAVLPFYVAHVAFISSLSKRFSLLRLLGRCSLGAHFGDGNLV